MIEVIADDREDRAGIVQILNETDNVTVTIKRLKVGDYLVNRQVVIERKTAADFIASLIDGRLFKQACLLAGSAFRSVLILEGDLGNAAADMHVRRDALQGAIITLTVVIGIPLLRSFDQAETARLIRYTGDQVSRSVDGSVHRSGYRPKGLHRRRLFVLQGLPGIGSVRARGLLEAFGSISAIMSADETALAGVAGIGRKTAAAIRQVAVDKDNPAIS